MKVYHYVAKLGYGCCPRGSHRVDDRQCRCGALKFDVDGAGANTYPAINVGAKIGYRLSPRVQLLLSPQGDIAFTKDEDVGTSNAWVWPFTAGVRIGL